MLTKEPKVTLISFPPNFREIVYWAINAQHWETVPSDLSQLSATGEEIQHYWSKAVKDYLTNAFEFVGMVWLIENSSRMFQKFLTSHKIGFSYSIQSLRVLPMKDFASRGAYYCPPSARDSRAYQSAMLDIQSSYNEALTKEANQDARGLLPMAVHSSITFACNLMSLSVMVKNCMVRGGPEASSIAQLIVDEVATRMGPEPIELFKVRGAK